MFWEQLCHLCTKNKCKPNTVAKAIGLSTATATKWKNGTIPNGEALSKIADYFNCSVDYLLGRTDNPQINSQDEATKEIKFETFGDIIDFIDALSKTYGIEFKIIDREETNETYMKEGYKKSCNIVFPLYPYGSEVRPDTISPKSARANIALAPALREFQDIQNKINDCINTSELTNSQKGANLYHYEYLKKHIGRDFKIEDSLDLEDIFALRDERNKKQSD